MEPQEVPPTDENPTPVENSGASEAQKVVQDARAAGATDAQIQTLINDLGTKLDALPEVLVGALKEAFPAPKQSRTPAPKTDKVAETPPPAPEPEHKPGKKTFVQHWFGG